VREVADETEVLPPGEVVVDGGILPGKPDQLSYAFGVPNDIEPENTRVALVGLKDGREDAHGRRFAGAIGPKKAEDGSLRDTEVDTVEGDDCAEPLGESVYRDYVL
jgi:hypothetical protein